MIKQELQDQIRKLAESCDKSDEQQAVKSILCGVLGAMCANREIALMNHAAKFAENEVRRLTAARN